MSRSLGSPSTIAASSAGILIQSQAASPPVSSTMAFGALAESWMMVAPPAQPQIPAAAMLSGTVSVMVQEPSGESGKITALGTVTPVESMAVPPAPLSMLKVMPLGPGEHSERSETVAGQVYLVMVRVVVSPSTGTSPVSTGASPVGMLIQSQVVGPLARSTTAVGPESEYWVMVAPPSQAMMPPIWPSGTVSVMV